MPSESVSVPPLLWEQHCCLPLAATARVGELARYARSGGAFVSVNVGYSPHSAADVRELTGAWHAQLDVEDQLLAAVTVGDVDRARERGQVAVGFDLEDCAPLAGRLERVARFYDLGVRTLVPTYNVRNAAGGGCLDESDQGLTCYGRDLVAELNRVGMVVDGSHCGARTGLDLSAASTRPMVYSHSCMRAVWDHPRNITDEQALACAARGGVIGITGVGIFLGPNDASLDALVRHLDYAVELVGAEHVGAASDYPFDVDDFNRELADHAELFPDSYTRYGPIEFLPPEGLHRLADALQARGYPQQAVAGILGANFRRVAQRCWRQDQPPLADPGG